MEPLPYHRQIRDYLKEEEAEIWNWYRSNRVQEDQAETVRFELLKSTYRIDRDSQPDWYEIADQARERLNLDVPVTIYQAQNAKEMNAGLAYLPSEAHIILSGPVASTLSREELLSVFAHELAHLLLWRQWDGEFLIVDQILAALANDRKAHPAHLESMRLFYLYNEIFCDRGSLFVANDPNVVVSSLVKISSGLDSVNAESYLKQAAEIVERASGPSQSISHPESYIRARAVQFWHQQDVDAEAKITEMIQGPLALNELDLLAQSIITAKTRRMIDLLLAPSWMQTDTMLGHARRFFDTYTPPAANYADESLAADLLTKDQPLINYYCYVLLDFVTVDRDLEEAPLAVALILAEQLKLQSRFVEIVRKELKLRKNQLERIDREKTKVVENAAKEFAPKP
ncbi:hypothetical protein DSM3645_14690 [Blastopirellula marina DSM 3645]|uniref:SprT-like domain-containing protein n=1 Tax=Blastopirellula marina DSM 3645 TaxID=314230 RepID=A3ZSE2_9BACT|nr:hypothetical protein DSM3645_14690 [Blastopirellula marina DSM 3645]